MRIVITGALGHVGSKLIREFPLRFPDSELVLLNRYDSQRYYPLFDLPEEGKYRFFGIDILKENLLPIFEGADAVIHLASRTRTTHGTIGEDMEALNLAATRRVATACIQTKAPLISLSTTSVYAPRSSEVSEDCQKVDLSPQSLYADTKLREEELLQTMSRDSDLKYVICRFGTIFGFSTGMRFDTAVNKFCWQATLGQPVSVWRTALEQSRPYLDVADAVRALMFFTENKIFDNRVYNVLTLNTSVSHILSSIRKEIPDLTVQFIDDKKMNNLSYRVLTRRLEDLGFEFRGNLERAVREVLGKLKGVRYQAIQALKRAV